MRNITFKIRHGNITAHEEKSQGARREWTVTGQVDFYLLGSFLPSQWVQAANLAMQTCQEMNIPLSQLVTVKTVNTPKMNYSPDTKKMF
jgi:hypothetical protein